MGHPQVIGTRSYKRAALSGLLGAALTLCICASRAEDDPAPSIGLRRQKPADISALSIKLKSGLSEEVTAAAEELAASRDPRALKPLWALYIDSGAEQRALAIHSIGALGDAGQCEPLFRVVMSDLYAGVRNAAADELVKLEGAELAGARYVEALHDAKRFNEVFRFRALKALGRGGGPSAAPALRQALVGSEIPLAAAAAEVLGASGDLSNAEALIAALKSQDLELKPAAADALEKLTGMAYHYDMVKWSAWQAEHAAASTAPQKEPAAYHAEQPEPVDIVIVFDTTGSMTSIWPELSTAINAVLTALRKSSPSLRIGLVRYRSVDPEATLKYVIKPTALTRDYDGIKTELNDALFGGGSGALHAGLLYAIGSMPWRTASRQAIVLVGDDSPDAPTGNPMKICLDLAHDAGAVDGIPINTLYVKTSAGEQNRVTYRAIAAAGTGRFYEYNRAERHLVEMSAEKVDVKDTELPAETAVKWIRGRGSGVGGR